jgi:hypothetical protein
MPPRWRDSDAAPREWLALAKKYDLPIPPGLEEAVAKYDGAATQGVVEKGDGPKTSDSEIDQLILDADARNGYQVGVPRLFKEAQEKGLNCTKTKIGDRAKLLVWPMPNGKGRPKKRPK